jgi:ATP-dependent RNA helicase DDX3X
MRTKNRRSITLIASCCCYFSCHCLCLKIDDYVHRIGRTGRAGNKGTAISFVDERKPGILRDLYDLMKENKMELPAWFESLATRGAGFGGGGRGFGGGRGGGGGGRGGGRPSAFGGRDVRREDSWGGSSAPRGGDAPRPSGGAGGAYGGAAPARGPAGGGGGGFGGGFNKPGASRGGSYDAW